MSTEEQKAYARKYYQKHREWYLVQMRRYKQEHLEELRMYDRNHRQEMKLQVVVYYSQGTNKCAQCGEADIRVLQIDHINGGGSEHRRSIGRLGGNGFYRWIIRNNYPKGFQVLCANCNIRKRWEQQEYGVKT